MELDKQLLYLDTYSSMSTVNNARYALRLFLQSVYGEGNLEQLATRYIKEEPDPRKDIQNFFSEIKHRPPASIRVLISHTKTFLLENEIEIPQRFWRRLSRRIKGTSARTQDKVPSNKELKQILMQMPQHGVTLFLVLASSGMMIGECLQLKISDIGLDEDPPQINLRPEYTKTGNRRTAFISQEAKQYIKEWLKNRLAYIRSAAKRGRFPRDPMDERLFPFSQTNALNIWHNAIKKARLNERYNGTNRYKLHPHVLRKFFRTRLGAVIPVDVAEALMGHQGYLTQAYRRYSVEDLGKIYKEGESALTIFSDKYQIDLLKGKLENKNQQLQQLVTGLSTENLTLKTDIEKQKKESFSLENNLNHLSALVKDVENIWMTKVQFAAQGLADKWVEKWKKEFIEITRKFQHLMIKATETNQKGDEQQ